MLALAVERAAWSCLDALESRQKALLGSLGARWRCQEASDQPPASRTASLVAMAVRSDDFHVRSTASAARPSAGRFLITHRGWRARGSRFRGVLGNTLSPYARDTPKDITKGAFSLISSAAKLITEPLDYSLRRLIGHRLVPPGVVTLWSCSWAMQCVQGQGGVISGSSRAGHLIAALREGRAAPASAAPVRSGQ